MNAIIILLLIDTVLQLFICHFSLWWIVALITRLLFATRLIGAVFKTKKLCIAEGAAIAIMLVWHFVFSKGNIPWRTILLFSLFSAFAMLLMFLDDLLYVYVIEDVEDE